MARFYDIYLWKRAPFLRLLLPFIGGILLGFYFQPGYKFIIILFLLLIILYIFFSAVPLVFRFKFQLIQGVIITLFTTTAGLFITWNKDIRNHNNWYGNYSDSSSYIIATITEPLVDKNKSLKTIASVDGIIKRDSFYNTRGKLLLYLIKDSLHRAPLQYGNKIIIRKQLSEIKNSGNPSAFNYKRYCAFQQIFYQCFLKKNDWALLKEKEANYFNRLIFKTRSRVINILGTYITRNDEKALAKALLIGYKVDLDKDLVQAYSNAGVVHLIAISGLHLGLIYVLLLLIADKIPFLKKSKIIQLLVLLTGLWFFTLLTGASASVLRSAVMFTFIAFGNTFKKNSSIYNSLSASAFLLLCVDPYMLWDVGFQLSYCAVLGIVIAQKHIYNWFYFTNKIPKMIWQLASVSLSAQLFTLPLCIFYFHQVPLLFLFSNLMGIPLATITLWGCLALILISPLHMVAFYLGKIITGCIWLLNNGVLFINSLPFSLWDGISMSIIETIVMYLAVIFFLYWLIKKNLLFFKFGLCCTLLLTGITSFKKLSLFGQKKIIVYNVPGHEAIDFINRNSYHFTGDSDLTKDGLLQNFHLKPGRIFFMLDKQEEKEFPLFQKNKFYQFFGKRILIIDCAINYKPLDKKIDVDYIIISKNPKLFIPKLAQTFNCTMYIFDACNPLWKIDKWKKDCEELHLRFHSVPEQGAFITDL